MFLGLNQRHDLHLARKLFHMTSVFAIFLCVTLLETKMNWIIYFSFGLPALLFDLSRQGSGHLNKVALRWFRPILRKSEMKGLSGASFAIVGVGLVYHFFPLHMAQLSILFLAIGDPIASFFGILWGRHKIGFSKSLEGSGAAWFFCSLAAFGFFYTTNTPFDLYKVVICGAIGGFAEWLPIGKLDDNLTQPLVSAVLLSVYFSFF